MPLRRDLLQTLVTAGTIGVAGCNTISHTTQTAPQDRTQTATLTPTSPIATETNYPTDSPTGTPPNTGTITSIGTPPTTPAVAESVSTPVYKSESSVDEFGKAVALSAETAVVVAEEHGAYVFDADGDGWTNTSVLVPTDREAFGGYEPSAALVGDRAVVGGPEAGAVYLFERTEEEWIQSERFAPDTTEAGEFGRSVAFDGKRVVVGDANEPTTMVSYVGGAYVFANDGETWTREASFATGKQDLFGTAVAIDGKTVLAGAPFSELDGNQTGAVYAYRYVDDAWQEQAVLSPDDPTDVVYEGRFGQAVAVDGDTAVIGAPEIPRGPGRAYVFERMATGWSQKARVTSPDIDEGAEFGRSVAIVGDTVIVGAPQANETGQAYVFTASDTWSDPLRLTGTDMHDEAEFGAAVALSETTALVGAPVFDAASGAYLFDLSSSL